MNFLKPYLQTIVVTLVVMIVVAKAKPYLPAFVQDLLP